MLTSKEFNQKVREFSNGSMSPADFELWLSGHSWNMDDPKHPLFDKVGQLSLWFSEAAYGHHTVSELKQLASQLRDDTTVPSSPFSVPAETSPSPQNRPA